jgi:hypothetical protein
MPAARQRHGQFETAVLSLKWHRAILSLSSPSGNTGVFRRFSAEGRLQASAPLDRTPKNRTLNTVRVATIREAETLSAAHA